MLVLRNLVQDLKSVAADPAEEDSLPDDAGGSRDSRSGETYLRRTAQIGVFTKAWTNWRQLKRPCKAKLLREAAGMFTSRLKISRCEFLGRFYDSGSYSTPFLCNTASATSRTESGEKVLERRDGYTGKRPGQFQVVLAAPLYGCLGCCNPEVGNCWEPQDGS